MFLRQYGEWRSLLGVAIQLTPRDREPCLLLRRGRKVKFNILLTTYEVVLSDAEWLAGIKSAARTADGCRSSSMRATGSDSTPSWHERGVSRIHRSQRGSWV